MPHHIMTSGSRATPGSKSIMDTIRLYIWWKILLTMARLENTKASTIPITSPLMMSPMEYKVYDIRLPSLKPSTKAVPISGRDGNISSGKTLMEYTICHAARKHIMNIICVLISCFVSFFMAA